MLTARVAWVTGATGGLGPAVARALGESGATVVATARDQTRLQILRDEIGLPEDRWLAIAGDLTDPAVTTGVVKSACDRFGKLDILVAVAGGWRGGKTVAETDLATFEWLWRVNLLTFFNACQAVLPGMLARNWGRIIAIGARSAMGGQARSGAYAASKAAVLALTQSIAAETRQSGVTANVVLLSTVDTSANRASMPDADHTRWVPPEQIAAVVRFLCSDEAASISGSAIPIYGRA